MNPYPHESFFRKNVWLAQILFFNTVKEQKLYLETAPRVLAHVISYGGTFLNKFEADTGISALYIDREMPADKLEANSLLELKGLRYTEGVKFSRKVARAINNPTGEINLLEDKW